PGATAQPWPLDRLDKPGDDIEGAAVITAIVQSRMNAPQRTTLAPDLEISRIVTGLWQVADMERGGQRLDPDAAGAALAEYAEAGFDTFDMADHYGSAEKITGRCLRLLAARGAPAPKVFT